MENVILVDDDDQQIGTLEKLAAHRAGALHRAFSIMIFDARGHFLLHQRALGKYHSGGLWTNACCGHPRPGEDVAESAVRRLGEELGFTCPLTFVDTFRYRAELDRDMIEHEIVHIFHGRYDGPINPDPSECADYAWVPLADLRARMTAEPHTFTAWLTKYVAADWPVQSIV